MPDTTDVTETAGDVSQSEDEDKDVLSRGLASEALECREERKEEPILRQVHTPPAKPPVKMLTRLGSLDGQYSRLYFTSICMRKLLVLFYNYVFENRFF